MLIHQNYNSVGNEVYKINVFKNANFELHLHKCYEFVYLFQGSTVFFVNKKEYVLRQGESILLTPYQIHRSQDSQNALILVITFPSAYVNQFTMLISDKVAKSPVFTLPPETRDYVLFALFGDFKPQDRIRKFPPSDILTTKSILYSICAEFVKQSVFEEKKALNESLLFGCLQYIENHYTSEITLTDMATALNYDYSYLSRYFNQALEINFKSLVNQYRCEQAQQLIVSTDKSITEIALESGFQSIRSFNRIFKILTGTSPAEFRKNRIEGNTH